ncbi:Nucleic-acid-binding protein from mobile element jockey [Neolecta irregularis DAH-3]|uniref:Nucleic-acid-binding protein from mobile element jockey n=1 Tax=Neolecta irregularis (strain DAH-3) TaxID=1198029 RepID=A0A1U7LJ86_NEOID|nr:Nucleic-acid-binding protein from mobile element jockey [Neolecta irregularis DAH-3]|eukprot:OLL22715.1 Nucleic-acid-binding protein from mobile element jockey [Neolecta irregularis DAH-3]
MASSISFRGRSIDTVLFESLSLLDDVVHMPLGTDTKQRTCTLGGYNRIYNSIVKIVNDLGFLSRSDRIARSNCADNSQSERESIEMPLPESDHSHASTYPDEIDEHGRTMSAFDWSCTNESRPSSSKMNVEGGTAEVGSPKSLALSLHTTNYHQLDKHIPDDRPIELTTCGSVNYGSGGPWRSCWTRESPRLEKLVNGDAQLAFPSSRARSDIYPVASGKQQTSLSFDLANQDGPERPASIELSGSKSPRVFKGHSQGSPSPFVSQNYAVVGHRVPVDSINLSFPVVYATIDKISTENSNVPGLDITELAWLTRKGHHPVTSALLIRVTSSATMKYLVVNGIIINGQIILCNKFKPKSIQCSRCYRWGHGVSLCKAKWPTCPMCAGVHERSACGMGPKEYVCVTCGGSHTAWDRRCPERPPLMKAPAAKI